MFMSVITRDTVSKELYLKSFKGFFLFGWGFLGHSFGVKKI